jgi:hypothetical protein
MPPNSETRYKLHTRKITVEGYRRADGLYEIEGHLSDVKTFDIARDGVERPSGSPMHEMRSRLTVDATLRIVDAEAQSLATPTQFCMAIAPAYRALVGMSLTPGFTREMQERLGGVKGCTHHTELVRAMAMTAYQVIVPIAAPGDGKPTQLDKCYGVASDGPYVAKFFPAWYRG